MARRFAKVADAFDELTAEGQAQVTQWKASRSISRWNDPAPFAAERHGEQRGRLVKAPADGDWAWRDEIGLDPTGRCVIVRERKADGEVTAVTVMLRRGDRLERARFAFDSLVGRRRFVLHTLGWTELDDDDKPLATHEYQEWEEYDFDADAERTRSGFLVERYDYDDAGRVVRAETRYSPPDVVDPRKTDGWTTVRTLRAVYDDAGKLQTVDEDATWFQRGEVAGSWVERTGSSRVWRAPVNRERIKEWSDAVEAHLVRAVMNRVVAVADGEIAAVALLYDEQYALPPTVGVLLASERDGFVNKYGDDCGAYVWNPPDWSLFDDGGEPLVESDPGIARAVAELNLEDQAAHTHERSRRLLNRVANQLNEATWPASMTDDFIVFSTDTEQTELLANLRAAVPAPLLKRHRRQPWWPE